MDIFSFMNFGMYIIVGLFILFVAVVIVGYIILSMKKVGKGLDKP